MKNIKENLVSYTSVMAFCGIGLFAMPSLFGTHDAGNTDLTLTTHVSESSSTLDDNKAEARKFYEAWNAKNPAALDELMADNYKSNTKLPGVTPDREGMKQWFGVVLTAFPDVHFTVEQQIAEGDIVVTRWSAKGTHDGPMMGMPATGKKTKVTGINIVRFKNGKSVESWGEWDAMGMMHQINPEAGKKAKSGK